MEPIKSCFSSCLELKFPTERKNQLAITLLIVSILVVLFSFLPGFAGLLGLKASAPLLFRAIGGCLTIYGVFGLLSVSIFSFAAFTGSIVFLVIEKRSSHKQNFLQPTNSSDSSVDSSDEELSNHDSKERSIEKSNSSVSEEDDFEPVNSRNNTKYPNFDHLRCFRSPWKAFQNAKSVLGNKEACIYGYDGNGKFGFILIWKDNNKYGFISKDMSSHSNFNEQLDFDHYIRVKNYMDYLVLNDASQMYALYKNCINGFRFVEDCCDIETEKEAEEAQPTSSHPSQLGETDIPNNSPSTPSHTLTPITTTTTQANIALNTQTPSKNAFIPNRFNNQNDASEALMSRLSPEQCIFVWIDAKWHYAYKRVDATLKFMNIHDNDLEAATTQHAIGNFIFQRGELNPGKFIIQAFNATTYL